MEITTRMTIAQRIPAFWAHSNTECTLENGEEDEEFDKASLMRAVAEVAGGGCFETRARQRVLWLGIGSKGAYALRGCQSS
jgi:hypothetical protein